MLNSSTKSVGSFFSKVLQILLRGVSATLTTKNGPLLNEEEWPVQRHCVIRLCDQIRLDSDRNGWLISCASPRRFQINPAKDHRQLVAFQRQR
jgi:hypothetical protein